VKTFSKHQNRDILGKKNTKKEVVHVEKEEEVILFKAKKKSEIIPRPFR